MGWKEDLKRWESGQIQPEESYASAVNWILSDNTLRKYVRETKDKGGSHNYKLVHSEFDKYVGGVKGGVFNVYSMGGRHIIKKQIVKLLEIRTFLQDYESYQAELEKKKGKNR